MSDLIRTDGYSSTTTQQVSSQQVNALEDSLESKTVAKIDQGKLAPLAAKLAAKEKLTDADAQVLVDMSKGLTAKDIGNLVADGKLNSQEGDLLLAASTLGAFTSGSGSETAIANGLTRLFTEMSPEDKNFTLDTFAKQGSYTRDVSISGQDGALSAAYQLSANGEKLAPGDLPSTPEIQRAALFVMSDQGDASQAGAVQAFTNWDFKTSTDQMSALLGTLPSYENLGPDMQKKMAAYLVAAGKVASTSASLSVAAANNRNAQTDAQSAMTALKSMQGKSGESLADVTFKDTSGKSVSLLSYLKANDIAVCHNDQTGPLGAAQADVLDKALAAHQTKLQNDGRILDLQVKGADAGAVSKLQADFKASEAKTAGYIDKLQQNVGKREDAANLEALTRAYTKEYSSGKKMDAANTTFTDHTGAQVKVADWLNQNHVAWADSSETAGISWTQEQYSYDQNKVLDANQIIGVTGALENFKLRLDADNVAAEVDYKADWPGAEKTVDFAKEHLKVYQTARNATNALSIGRMDDPKFNPDLSTIKFKDADGKEMSIQDYMDSQMPGTQYMSSGDQLNLFYQSQQQKAQESVAVLSSVKANLAGLQPPADSAAEADAAAAEQSVTQTAPTSRWATASSDAAGAASSPVAQPATASPSSATGVSVSMKASDALDTAKSNLDQGQVMGPDEFAKFGFNADDTIDIGMLMFTVQSERLKMIGSQIQSIIQEQRKNTNDQKDMQEAIGTLNSQASNGGDLAKLTFTLSNGKTTTVKDYFDSHDVKYNTYSDHGTDAKLSKEQVQTAISNAKGAAEGMSNDGQSIMNELTMLSQKYQQAESLAMNFLEKFDAMKMKIIDKIRPS